VLLVRRSCTPRGRGSEKCNLSCDNVGDIGGTNRHSGHLASRPRAEIKQALEKAKVLGMNRSPKFAPVLIRIRHIEDEVSIVTLQGSRLGFGFDRDDAMTLHTANTKSFRYGTTCTEVIS
jgi:hypothetical protein